LLVVIGYLESSASEMRIRFSTGHLRGSLALMRGRYARSNPRSIKVYSSP
jgi:hypothetical protein